MTAVAPPGTTAAHVGDRHVTASDVDDRIAALRAGPSRTLLPPASCTEGRQLRRWVVQLLVTEALLDAECDLLGVTPAPDDPPVVGDRTAALELGSLTSAALASSARRRALFRTVTAGATVREEDVAAFHARNPERYRRPEVREVRHVLLEDADTAQTVYAALRDGADFDATAARLSCDRGSRHRGGRLGTVTRGDLGGDVDEALFSARPGSLLPPVCSAFGWHVLRVDRVRPGVVVPLSQVRDAIAAELIAAARRRCFVAWLDARRAALVTLAPGSEHPGDPRQPDHTHRH